MSRGAAAARAGRRARAAIVYNPVKVHEHELRDAVAHAEKAAGWRPSTWLETTEDDPGTGHARRAVADGAAMVIAAGGDGTVRAVAEGLRGTGIPLGLLPLGTGNLLARNLDLPLSHADQALRTAFQGRSHPIDIGLVELTRPDGTTDEHAFVVMAGVGLDARMVANTNPELKRRLGWFAYVDAIARSLRDRNQLRVTVSADDDATRSMRAHTVLVGNCGLLPGNILLLPEASLDDGLLDVVTLRPEGLAGWLQIWTKVLWENGVLRRSSVGRRMMGQSREVRTLHYLQASRFQMSVDDPEEFELDGDEFGVITGFTATVDPGGLLVRVAAG